MLINDVNDENDENDENNVGLRFLQFGVYRVHMACEQNEGECQSKQVLLLGALLTTISNNMVAVLPATKST